MQFASNPSPVLNRLLANVRGNLGGMKVLCLGDSKVWGSITGDVAPAGPGGSSWPSQLATFLSALGIPADLGLSIPQASNTNVPATDTRWVTAAGWTTGYATYPTTLFGIGGAASWLGALGCADLTYTPGTSCDTFDVYYVSAVGFGTFKMAIDAAASGGTVVNAGVAPTAIKKATIAGGISSAHVLHLGAPATTGFTIVGIDSYLSLTGKVRVGNAGVVGCSAFQIADQLVPQALASLSTIRAYAPDLTIINLSGTIDGLYSFTPTQVMNAIQAIIATCALTGDVILMTETPTLPGIANIGSTVALETSLAAMMAQYAVSADLSLVDMFAAFQPVAQMQALGFYNWTLTPADAFHLSATGNKVIASMALRSILRLCNAYVTPIA